MSRRFALGTLLALAWVSPGICRDTFDSQHQQALAGNPAGVHLQISLGSGQTSFHIGDTIQLKYEFMADSTAQYVAGARYLDYGQRSVLESFFTDRPADARDPLQDYWAVHETLAGHLSARSEPNLKLGVSPQFDSVEVTHYLRFFKPGRYRLYVVTRSVLSSRAAVTESPPCRIFPIKNWPTIFSTFVGPRRFPPIKSSRF